MSQISTNEYPRVSIVIPAFNAVKTLPATIASIRAQTFSDWELIVVDDGSSDATASTVKQIAAQEKRVQLLMQSNKGPSAARNNGIKHGKGEVIAFLDADDTWDANHLEQAIDLLANDEQLGVAFAPCLIVSEDDTVTGQTRPSLMGVTAAQILAGNPTATCSSLVVRRQVISQAGMFREDMAYAEDQEWLSGLFLVDGSVVAMPPILCGIATIQTDFQATYSGCTMVGRNSLASPSVLRLM